MRGGAWQRKLVVPGELTVSQRLRAWVLCANVSAVYQGVVLIFSNHFVQYPE